MSDTPNLPPAALLVDHHVADYEVWKQAFDAHEEARRDAGVLGHHINRGEDDPNRIVLYMAVSDVDRARAFAASDDLKDAMAAAGVDSPPVMTWLTPVRESVVWDRELPAFIVTHKVADFDAWLEGYDDADELQRANGIVGQAANRSLDDPDTAIVYHQAESFDTLRAFLASPELQAGMAEAGVTSEPEVTFYMGGASKMY